MMNGPTTWAANVDSKPCEFTRRCFDRDPALWINASSRDIRAISELAARTCEGSAMSATTTSTDAPWGNSSRSERRVRSVRSRSRPTSTSEAPRDRNRRAVAKPSPEVAPVTAITRSDKESSPKVSQSVERERIS